MYISIRLEDKLSDMECARNQMTVLVIFKPPLGWNEGSYIFSALDTSCSIAATPLGRILDESAVCLDFSTICDD